MTHYTVLLLYPDYIASNYGQETYMAWVASTDVISAITEAQNIAWNDNMKEGDLTDYYCLAIFKGHYKNLKPGHGV